MQERESHLSYGIAPSTFRLPDATRIGGVRLQVSNLPRSVEYYEQVIGLRVSTATQDTAALVPQGDDRPLVTLQTGSHVTPALRSAFGLYHFAILLPDRAALGRFATHVAALGLRVGMADHLVSEALYLSDPDGLGIEVYVDRPRDAWQRRGRELAMTTAPLDITAVIAAGGRETWDGAPSRTTIGHVHLQVGSLAGAEAFYHGALGFDKTVWSYPGALFLSAGGYHHHLATNTWSLGPAPSSNQAQLLEWELLVPSHDDVRSVARSIRAGAYVAQDSADGVTVKDPWGTPVRVRTEG